MVKLLVVLLYQIPYLARPVAKPRDGAKFSFIHQIGAGAIVSKFYLVLKTTLHAARKVALFYHVALIVLLFAFR